jgi:hypothetical protein
MLMFTREYTDGRYVFMAMPILGKGNMVTLEDKLKGASLKQYFTTDDETALALFESMMSCYNDKGAEHLELYKSKDNIAAEYDNRIEQKIE